MNCPKCSNPMEHGWLVMFNFTFFNYVVWQATKPKFVRLLKPRNATTIFKPTAAGEGCPEGEICKKCHFVAFDYRPHTAAAKST